MEKLQAVFYILAIVLLIVAAFPVPTRISLALLGAASALLAYALPTIAA
jgi:hypothetical protein